MEIVSGETYSVEYPFIRVDFTLRDEEGSFDVEYWVPGCRDDEENAAYGNPEREADAHGKMLLTVIDKHKPGRYPERVFYIRRWMSPDGKVFGKENLRITTTAAFRTLIKGYRHPYIVEG